MSERKIRIAAAGQNALLREGIALLLSLHTDMDLVCSVASAPEVVRCFTERRPDVVLIDLDLPAGGGFSAIKQILKLEPAACIIGLLTYEWDAASHRALRAGARACLTTDRLNDNLISLMREEFNRR